MDHETQRLYFRTVQNDDVEKLTELVAETRVSWRDWRDYMRNTLIHETIRAQSYRSFTYLLQFCDVEFLEIVNEFEETALDIASCLKMVEFQDDPPYSQFVPDLTDKYEVLPSRYEAALLHFWIWCKSEKNIEKLLQKGIDPNARKPKGPCPLDDACNIGNIDTVCMLLISGTCPTTKFMKGGPFERFVTTIDNHYLEILFLYTFDELEDYLLNFQTILHMANDSTCDLFYEILQYQNISYVVEEIEKAITSDCFFRLEPHFFHIVVKKYRSCVSELFQGVRSSYSFLRFVLYDRHFPIKIKLLFESGALTWDQISELVCKLTTSTVTNIMVTRFQPLDEALALKLFSFLFECSLQIDGKFFDWVYIRYGFCTLFRNLLHMDHNPVEGQTIVLISLIRDLHVDVEFVCAQETGFYSDEKLLDVLDFFAHKKLKEFLLKMIRDEDLDFSEDELLRLEYHPEVPSLEELARNKFRKFLIERYKIETSRRFYSIVQDLGLDYKSKEIMCFERKLYR